MEYVGVYWITWDRKTLALEKRLMVVLSFRSPKYADYCDEVLQACSEADDLHVWVRDVGGCFASERIDSPTACGFVDECPWHVAMRTCGGRLLYPAGAISVWARPADVETVGDVLRWAVETSSMQVSYPLLSLQACAYGAGLALFESGAEGGCYIAEEGC